MPGYAGYGKGCVSVDGQGKCNHLGHEKSPYLLQHAQNPVDWFPWGDEAFAKAKEEDKPIFLSIGYSTCHWCHVMAHESFEDREVAEALNRDFVSIKVDREERPDVDAVYMAACQAITGTGGWPLTVLMTPEQKPFWVGTYLPKRAGYGRMGLLELLEAVGSRWDTNREALTESGEQIAAFLRKRTSAQSEEAEPEKALLDHGITLFKSAYDTTWGGFGSAPKFPSPHNLLFLLRASVLEQQESVRQMAEHTLVQMFRGGLFDHIGGGFSRYSTDERWLVPHFEKMLYDNALLVMAYSEAYRLTRRPLYREVIRQTLDYVLKELTDAQGGFYCSQDADSDGVEGKYYLLDPEEVRRVLGQKEGEHFCRWYGITDGGNFEGRSIPNLIDNPRFEEDSPDLRACRKTLYQYRLGRTRLHRDDKVLTSWNALMIAAAAKAGLLLEEPRYLEAARKAQRFLEENLVDRRGRLLLRWRSGEAAHDGQLEDYAFYAFSLLELYQTTWEVGYLERAVQVARQMLEWFSDRERGGFYLYAEDGEQLISRPKEVYDGAMPSGNSMAALVLTKLAALTGEEEWRRAADRQLSFVAGVLKDYPAGYAVSLLALSLALWPSRELICVTVEEEMPPELRKLLRENRGVEVSVLLKTRENTAALARVAPFTAEYPLKPGEILYYFCKNGVCSRPTGNLDSIRREFLP